MLTTDDLLARAEITDVIQRLARGTDRLDQELMASCYHPDGFDDAIAIDADVVRRTTVHPDARETVAQSSRAGRVRSDPVALNFV